MKTVLQLLAAIMFVVAILGLLGGLLLEELALGIGSLIGGLVFATILYALSEIVDRLDILLENQRRYLKAYNAKEQANASRRRDY